MRTRAAVKEKKTMLAGSVGKLRLIVIIQNILGEGISVVAKDKVWKDFTRKVTLDIEGNKKICIQ